MENQQSFFWDPRERPEGRGEGFEAEHEHGFRAVNQDPREQEKRGLEEQRAYQSGYDGPYEGPLYRQALGEKLVPRRGRRRSNFLPLFILVAILILAISGFMTARYDRPWSRGYHERSSFEVEDNAQLVVNSDSGKVYVHTGDENRISVTFVTRVSRREARHMLAGTQARLLDEHTVAVDALKGQQEDVMGRGEQVDLDITVPEETSVTVHATGGEVSVDDVKGSIQVDTARDNIELDSTEGPVALTSISGNIEVNDVQLSGESSFKTSNGNIDFVGSLDPYGLYTFETTSGSTDITLPDSAAFRLDISGSSTSVLENEFHNSNVGKGQLAAVTVRTESGHVAIHEED